MECGGRSQEPGVGTRSAVGSERLLPVAATSFEGQPIAAPAEDGRFRPAADLRLSMVDSRFAKCPTSDFGLRTSDSVCYPPLWQLANWVRNGALTHKDVKNEDCSGDVYENKGKETKCRPLKSGFLHENAQIERQLTKICRIYGQKMRR